MPEDGGVQIKRQRRINLPPVVGKIGFDFTFSSFRASVAKICSTRCCSVSDATYAGAQRRHCPVLGCTAADSLPARYSPALNATVALPGAYFTQQLNGLDQHDQTPVTAPPFA